MLVLTRKQQETIRIGDNITITVLRIKGNQVRLGIVAPNAVRVLRGELTTHAVDNTAGEAEEGPNGQGDQEQPADAPVEALVEEMLSDAPAAGLHEEWPSAEAPRVSPRSGPLSAYQAV